jgi:outer membrane murein-binding lipoprotein Lpp
MKKFKNHFYLAIASAIIFFAGCASQPTLADNMRSQAAGLQAQVDLKEKLAADWDKGSKLVASGEKQVRDGERLVQRAEKDLRKGQEQINTGNRQIEEGRKLMEESELRFRDNFPDTPLNPGGN